MHDAPPCAMRGRGVVSDPCAGSGLPRRAARPISHPALEHRRRCGCPLHADSRGTAGEAQAHGRDARTPRPPVRAPAADRTLRRTQPDRAAGHGAAVAGRGVGVQWERGKRDRHGHLMKPRAAAKVPRRAAVRGTRGRRGPYAVPRAGSRAPGVDGAAAARRNPSVAAVAGRVALGSGLHFATRSARLWPGSRAPMLAWEAMWIRHRSAALTACWPREASWRDFVLSPRRELAHPR
jgi:hypothetical protein